MKKLKRIENFLINEIDQEMKSNVNAGRSEDTVGGCVEYTQIKQV